MQFHLSAQKQLTTIPSGSILERVDTHFWLVGDDANMLFILDENWAEVERRRIFVSEYEGERIPKKEKPDLEAGTICDFEGEKYFFVLGSGSKSPERDNAFLIPIEKRKEVQKITLTSFYDLLRKDIAIKELNIEAAFCVETQLFLVNRGGLFQENTLIIPDAPLWRAMPHTYRSILIEVPTINGIAAGISGATYHAETDNLWICASAENTTDAYNDGEIMGSLMGIIRDFSQKLHQNALQIDDYVLFVENPPIKLESLCISNDSNIQKIEITAVADNDDGTSILTKGKILF